MSENKNEFTTENQMKKICPFVSTSRINGNQEIEMAQVPCIGPTCAMWTQLNPKFGMCSFTASNEAVIHQQMQNVEEKEKNERS